MAVRFVSSLHGTSMHPQNGGVEEGPGTTRCCPATRSSVPRTATRAVPLRAANGIELTLRARRAADPC